MTIKTNQFYALVGALLGYFTIHPFVMILGHIMEMTEKGAINLSLKFFFSEYLLSFSVKMLPWAISIVLFNGSIGYFLGKLHEQNKLLKEANAAKDKFFSIIAHDLKSPFTVLIGFVRMLHNKYDQFDDDRKKEFLLRISTSAQETFKLLENLLNWSKFQLGGVVVEKKIILLSDVIDEVLVLSKNNADRKKISIKVEIDTQFPIAADKNMLMLIIRNLISNAIKFTEEGGSIKVSSKVIRKYVEISVSDTGVGIKKDHIHKLFRIDILHTESGTAKEQGTGLGLILCKEFIEKHGGSIRVKSEVGEGSEFTIRLPK